MDLNNTENLDEFLKFRDNTLKSLSTSILIDYEQVSKIFVIELRNFRKDKDKELTEAIDKVLISYLGEDDFEKYIVNNHEII